MPRKKFTLEQRKRMMERLESGATATDLRREFGITDPRTLQRQLRLAREEQTLQIARTDIVKESLRDHLAEVRTLIENWSAGIKAPSPPSFSRYPLSTAEQAEENRLFEGIREHLPFPELWRSYLTFKMKWDKYITTCENFHRQVVKKAKEKWGLSLLDKSEQRPGLTTLFSWDTLDYAVKMAMDEFQVKMLHYDAGSLNQRSPEIKYLMCNGRVILYANDAERYAGPHRAMVTEWARSEGIANLVKLLTELQNLEKRIHDIVEEALLRRDYILYSCRLCPGGGGLTFK